MAKEADVSCNPLFQDVHQAPNEKRESRREKQTYATQQLETNDTDNKKANNANEKQCIYCNMSNHRTYECGKINRLPFAEQHQFLKSNNLCFSCLSSAHSYKNCTLSVQCNICQGKHPTALHRMRTANSSQQNQSVENTNNKQQPHAAKKPNIQQALPPQKSEEQFDNSQ